MERINNAPDHLIRAVLVALCDDSSVEQKALNYLDKLEAKAAAAQRRSAAAGKNGAAKVATGSSSSSSSVTAKKRKAEYAIQICVQCKEPFYPEENVGKPCRYHDGEMDVDWDGDFWADHDEDCHGPIDTEENREEYPEGFVWDCCDQLGDASGCHRGPHRASK